MSFLGVLGGIAKFIGGTAVGVATGGPIGGITAATGMILGSRAGGGGVGSASALPIASRGLVGAPMSLPTLRMPTFASPAVQPPGAGSAMIPHLACGPGFHHAHQKGALGGLLASKCVKNRRMNVTNPRALRRSIRRLTGFEKLAKRVLRITTHKPVTVHGFKRRRRARR